MFPICSLDAQELKAVRIEVVQRNQMQIDTLTQAVDTVTQRIDNTAIRVRTELDGKCGRYFCYRPLGSPSLYTSVYLSLVTLSCVATVAV